MTTTPHLSRQHPLFRLFTTLLMLMLLGMVRDVSPTHAEDGTRISDARFEKLAKGVNFSFWFWYASGGDYNPNYIADSELDMLKSAGLTHVRLPFNPDLLMLDSTTPTQFDADYLAAMDNAVTRILAAGLAVIIDPHPLGTSESQFRQKIATDDLYLTNTALPFYQAYAAHFANYDLEMVFFETMNEPVMHEYFTGTWEEQIAQGIARWNIVQPQIVAALRAGAPNHTIIVKGETWDSIDSLLEVPILADTNVVYNFHFYDPFVFTHQGATWTSPEVQPLSGVPYPSSPQAVAPLLPGLSDSSREWVEWYGIERWDRSRVEARIQTIADWAAEHDVRLTVNEFGVYTPNAPADDRLSLLRDMRLSFEKFGIGWAMWDFDGGFDLVEGSQPTRFIAPTMAEALGLNVVGAATLISPAANEYVIQPAPVFSWAALDSAISYSLRVRDRGYDAPDYAFKQKFSAPSAICGGGGGLCIAQPDFSANGLPNNALLEWRVVTKTSSGEKRASTWQYFRVEMPRRTALISPVDEATSDTTNPVLSWLYRADAQTYKLVVKDTYPEAAVPKPVKFTLTTTSTPSIAQVCDTTSGICAVQVSQVGQPLNNGAYYKWRVTTGNTYGTNKSEAWNFLVNAPERLPLPAVGG
jgi:hypothetical protein